MNTCVLLGVIIRGMLKGCIPAFSTRTKKHSLRACFRLSLNEGPDTSESV